MHIVAWMGNRDVAELLLERGADPNKGDNYGETPLDIAQRHGHEDIVNLMLPNMMGALRNADSPESVTTESQESGTETQDTQESEMEST